MENQPQRGRGRGNLRGSAAGVPGRQQPNWKAANPQGNNGGGKAGGEPAAAAAAAGGAPSSSAVCVVQRAAAGPAGDAPGRGAMRGTRRVEEIVVTRLPNAPTKQGTSGSKTILKTNYFRLIRKDQCNVVFQYRIDFEPVVEDSRFIHELLKTQGPVIGPYIFDGTMLFLYNKLKSDEIELQVKDNRRDTGLYKLKIRHVGTVDMASEQAVMILNLMHRQAMKSLKLLEMNRNFFDPLAKITIPQYGLELYPGYTTSIRQHQSDVMLCVEITHRVLRTETVYKALMDMQRHPSWKINFTKALIGSVVMTIYNDKTYKVTDVDYNVTPSSTFSKKDGSNVSFMDYFKQTYNITIRDPRQPMLVSMPSLRQQRAGVAGPIMLVPELCRMTGITDDMRRDFNLMRAIADHTRIGADKRIERLQKFNSRLQEGKESVEVFKYWKTELDRRLVEVPARTLGQESIIFQMEAPHVPAGPEADWSSALRNNRMFKSVPLNNWYVVCLRGQESLVKDFLGCIQAAAKGIGFNISHPQIVLARDDMTKTYVDTLSDLVNKDPQLIMCVVSNDREERYRAIKKKCCIDRAIPTQVIKARTITPKGGNPRTLMSVATKVTIQLNCKLGGIPWIVKNPLSSVMVVGFDVCHDPANKSKSYGALVATMYATSNGPEPRFYSSIEPHVRGEELSSFISTNIVKALRAYQKEFGVGVLPRRIIVYRDGVGEGQLKGVVKHEVSAIKGRLADVYANNPDFKVQLTIVVVNKRINSRFFQGGRNPPPGTIVDDIVTLPERTDFYLISQTVRQGTVSPTGYNVIYDESGLKADQLQVYTSKQTHLYYNWCGSVAVPAVCQYAHKLAFLTAQYLCNQPNQLLENRLYYL